MLDNPSVTNPELLEAAIRGLSEHPKRMSPKWFYDDAGSALFENITRLPEYYPSRTETAILQAHAAELEHCLARADTLVELGSGASVKTRILLDALPQIAAYAPLDISAEFLDQSARELDRDYPALRVDPIVADFMAPITLDAPLDLAEKAVFFPGSTIGNLERHEAVMLLRRLRGWQNVPALILGLDLVKDQDVLIRAYDDSAGVTAAFNKNLLERLNREAGARIDPDGFAHEARWNVAYQRIEMHLVSRTAQTIRLGRRDFDFAEGESIHTENSHKFTREMLDGLALESGWIVEKFWTDGGDNFAVAILCPEGG